MQSSLVTWVSTKAGPADACMLVTGMGPRKSWRGGQKPTPPSVRMVPHLTPQHPQPGSKGATFSTEEGAGTAKPAAAHRPDLLGGGKKRLRTASRRGSSQATVMAAGGGVPSVVLTLCPLTAGDPVGRMRQSGEQRIPVGSQPLGFKPSPGLSHQGPRSSGQVGSHGRGPHSNSPGTWCRSALPVLVTGAGQAYSRPEGKGDLSVPGNPRGEQGEGLGVALRQRLLVEQIPQTRMHEGLGQGRGRGVWYKQWQCQHCPHRGGGACLVIVWYGLRIEQWPSVESGAFVCPGRTAWRAGASSTQGGPGEGSPGE